MRLLRKLFAPSFRRKPEFRMAWKTWIPGRASPVRNDDLSLLSRLIPQPRLGNYLVWLLLPILLLFSCSYGQAQTPLSLPEPALQLLAESAAESCSICARQLREQAYDFLDQDFPLERILATTESCLLLRSPLGEENELVLSCDHAEKDSLPLLIFRFHTQASHLVGISPGDFTADEPAAEYLAAGPGTAFEGTLKIVAFRYGNRPSFNYSAGRGIIQVHCRILTLQHK